jgi:hypothetical protein
LGAFFPPATLQPQPAQESARNNLTLGGVLSSSYTSTATRSEFLDWQTLKVDDSLDSDSENYQQSRLSLPHGFCCSGVGGFRAALLSGQLSDDAQESARNNLTLGGVLSSSYTYKRSAGPDQAQHEERQEEDKTHLMSSDRLKNGYLKALQMIQEGEDRDEGDGEDERR